MQADRSAGKAKQNAKTIKREPADNHHLRLLAGFHEKPIERQKVLKKINFFRAGKYTYFHHRYGAVEHKSRLRTNLFAFSGTLVFVGGVFSFTQFALPAIKSINLFQNAHQLAPKTIVSAEANILDRALPPISHEDEELKHVISDRVNSYPKTQKWSVVFYDLNNDREVKINAERTYPAASLYKIFLLEALEAKVPYDKWAKTKFDKQTTIAACVTVMLKESDDPCAQALAEYIGLPAVDELNNKNGYSKTKFGGIEGKQTTPEDVGKLFRKLKKGQSLSDKARRFVFDALYQQLPTRGIMPGCNGCRTATKAGELSGVAHDAGIVTHGGNNYVLVVMSEGGTFEQITELTKLIEEQTKTN